MKVKNWMTPDPRVIEQSEPVRTAVLELLTGHMRHIPVTDDGRLVGIVSDRDLKQALPSIKAGASSQRYQAFMNGTSVGQLMTRDPLTCTPETDVIDVVKQFQDRKVGALPVVDGDRLVGIVTQTDMMRAFLAVLEDLAERE